MPKLGVCSECTLGELDALKGSDYRKKQNQRVGLEKDRAVPVSISTGLPAPTHPIYEILLCNWWTRSVEKIKTSAASQSALVRHHDRHRTSLDDDLLVFDSCVALLSAARLVLRLVALLQLARLPDSICDSAYYMTPCLRAPCAVWFSVIRTLATMVGRTLIRPEYIASARSKRSRDRDYPFLFHFSCALVKVAVSLEPA
jgi:hypothetical protein